MYIYYVLMFAFYVVLRYQVYPDMRQISSPRLQEASNLLFALCVLLTFYLSNSDPGCVKPLNDDPDLFFKLLITYDPESLCPDCQIMKTARCRHCNYCDRCIERFDHHCPWINNCVGAENYKLFYLFVVFQLLYVSI